MTDEQITIGETYRLVERLDRRVAELTNEMRGYGALNVRMDNAEQDITEIKVAVKVVDDKVSDVVKNAAFMSGGISLMAFFLSWWPWGKH